MIPKNLFIGKSTEPSDQELAQLLGSSQKIWDQLVSQASSVCEGANPEWHSHSPKAGWSLRLKLRSRNIVYFSPCEDCLLASFALGEKAMQEAKALSFPGDVRKILNAARKYAEGTAVRIPVTSVADIKAVQRLIAIKLAH